MKGPVQRRARPSAPLHREVLAGGHGRCRGAHFWGRGRGQACWSQTLLHGSVISFSKGPHPFCLVLHRRVQDLARNNEESGTALINNFPCCRSQPVGMAGKVHCWLNDPSKPVVRCSWCVPCLSGMSDRF